MSVNIGTAEGKLRLVDEFTGPFMKVASQVNSIGGQIKSTLQGLGLTLSIGALAKSILDNVNEAEAAMAQLRAGVLSTGGAAGQSAEQLADYAGELQRLTGISDETIMSGQAILLTFTKIGEDAFPGATRAALDLSRRLGGDITGSAMMLGKALNDPVKGLTMLGRAGVQFSSAQEATIKKMVETNQIAAAQAVILKELETQVGGSAAAFRDTLPGALAALGNSWGDLLEEIGASGSGGFRVGIEGIVSGIDYLKDNWYAMEAAIFTTLGNISERVGQWVALWLTQFETAAGGLRTMMELTSLGFADTSKIKEFQEGIAGVKQTVLETSRELKQGFGIKAEEAIEAGIAPTKGLDDAMRRLGKNAPDVGDRIREAFEKANATLKLVKAAVEAIRKGSGAKEVQFMVDAAQTLGKDNLFDPMVQSLARVNQEAAKLRAHIEFIDKNGRLDTMKLGSMKPGEFMGINPDAIKTTNTRIRDLKLSIAEMKAVMKLDPAAFKSYEDYDAAVQRVYDSTALNQIIMEETANKSGPEVIETIIRLTKQYEFLIARQKELAKYNFTKLPWGEKVQEFGRVFKDAFAGVEGTLGRVGEAIGEMIEQFGAAETAAGKWGAALQGVSSVVQEFNKGTAGGFGAKGETNEAAMGSVVGQIIGAIVGAFTFIGPAAGAAIGGAIGGAAGSFIKHGADEAVSSLKLNDGTLKAINKWSEGGLKHVINNLAKDVDTAMKDLLAALGATVASIPSVTVKIRDGIIKVWVGKISGEFKSMEDAISFTVASLLKESKLLGLSDTMKTILEKTTADNLEELSANLDFGNWFDKLGIGAAGAQLIDQMADFRGKFAKALQLGLDTAPITEWATEQFDAMRNALLGIGNEAANQLANLASFQKGVAQLGDQINKALAQAMEALARAETANLKTSDKLTDEEKGIIESIPALKAAIASYLAQLDAIPAALSELEIDMGIFGILDKYLAGNKKYEEKRVEYAKLKVELEFAAIKMQLIALNKWEQFADMFTDAYNAAMGLAAGPPPKTGGGSGNRQDVRDFIADRKIDLAAAKLGNYGQQVLALDRQYDDLLKKAGKDQDLKKQLLALKEQELRLMGQEIRAKLIKPFLGDPNSGARSQFQTQMDEINKAYNDARAVADQTGNSVRNLTLAERERLRILGLQASAAAGSRTAATILEMMELAQTVDFLRDNADKLGVSFNTLIGELQAEKFVSLGDRLMAFIGRYYANAEGFEGFRMALEKTRFDLELANMRLQFDLLKAQGLLTEEVIARAEGVFGYIDSHEIDWSAFVSPVNTSSSSMSSSSMSSVVSDTVRAIESLKEAFKRAKDGIREFLGGIARGSMGLVSPEAALAAAREQYDRVMASANAGQLSGLQAAPDAARNLIEAMKAFSPVMAATQLSAIQAQMGALLNLNTVTDGNVTYTERFVAQQEITNQALTSGFNDLALRSSEQTSIQSASYSTLREIRSQLVDQNAHFSLLESARQAQRRSTLGAA